MVVPVFRILFSRYGRITITSPPWLSTYILESKAAKRQSPTGLRSALLALYRVFLMRARLAKRCEDELKRSVALLELALAVTVRRKSWPSLLGLGIQDEGVSIDRLEATMYFT